MDTERSVLEAGVHNTKGPDQDEIKLLLEPRVIAFRDFLVNGRKGVRPKRRGRTLHAETHARKITRIWAGGMVQGERADRVAGIAPVSRLRGFAKTRYFRTINENTKQRFKQHSFTTETARAEHLNRNEYIIWTSGYETSRYEYATIKHPSL